MTKITYSNLLSGPRDNVALIIKANVSDPTTSSSSFRKWIYTRLPDVKANDFSGYPFIIVHNANMISNIEASSGSGKVKNMEFSIDVEVVTSDVKSGTKGGMGAQYSDFICDQLATLFLNVTIRDSLRKDNMSFSNVDAGDDIEVIPIADELTYRKIITLEFSKRMVISA